MAKADERADLFNSVPGAGEERVTTRRGFAGEDEVPIDVSAYHTEGGETRLDLDVSADWVDLDVRTFTAYLDPLQAVVVGERLAASGRKALEQLVAGLEDD